ncbi:lactonase family protein [Clostridium thermarum]|uniref:lactonase family protein n=1 Tax=Clostridium thermarum TaxID=1716543 RepID=UPI0013D4C7AD|nr:lactonase family protein [Clostridium thermarum]
MDKENKCIVYVGNYTKEEKKGIYAYRLDEDGSLIEINSPQDIENPSYICFDRDKRYVYAVIERDSFQGGHGGGVAAYKIINDVGELQYLNSKGTKGVDPCHLITDKDNRHLYVANYTEGTFTTFNIAEDGSLGNLVDVTVHEGSGVDEVRQEKAHVHYVTFTPDEKFLLAVDLGIDKIKIYSVSEKSGIPTPVGEYKVKPGAGPRHLVFHPNGKYVYVINELSSEIVALRYISEGAILETIQYISTLPEGFKEFNNCAAVHVSKDGRFLYASNRGHDSIAVFRKDETTGKLELVSITPTGGEFPRDFGIDPSGRFLFAANQKSDTITSFRIDNETGELRPLPQVIAVQSPTCIKFLEL